MLRRSRLLGLVLHVALAFQCFAGGLVTWNAHSLDPDGGLSGQLWSTSVNPSSLYKSASLTSGSGPYPLYASGWSTTSVPSLGAYYEFTIAPKAGYAVVWNDVWANISIDKAGSDHGPTSWQLRSSLNGFASPLDTQLFSLVGLSTQRLEFDISGVPTSSGAITFRLYGYNATGPTYGGGYSGYLEALAYTVEVPESHPVGYLMFAGAGALLLFRHRRIRGA